jgi:hypothetical protein
MLLGSMAIAVPVAGICYFVAKQIVAKHHLKHPHSPPAEDEEVEP